MSKEALEKAEVLFRCPHCNGELLLARNNGNDVQPERYPKSSTATELQRRIDCIVQDLALHRVPSKTFYAMIDYVKEHRLYAKYNGHTLQDVLPLLSPAEMQELIELLEG